MLVRAIESVLAQTETRVEILVVDDGSSDETPQILRDIKDSRSRCFRSERAEGAPRARNRGIAESQGRHVALLDDDDELLPSKLALQLQCFEGAVPNVALGMVAPPWCRSEP